MSTEHLESLTILCARERYVQGDIDLDEFERRVARALRSSLGLAVPAWLFDQYSAFFMAVPPR